MRCQVIFCCSVAFILWTIMFSPWTSPYIPFWWAMTLSAGILITFSLIFGKRWHIDHSYWLKDIFIDLGLGIAIAAALWSMFWIGDKLSQTLFEFARPQVDAVYGMKNGWNLYLLSFLLLCIIGPAEEIFWRWFVQQSLGNTWQAALITVAIYTGVHLLACNLMLILAALVCGVVWGGLYYCFPKRFGAILISHAVWDAAVFIWFPIL